MHGNRITLRKLSVLASLLICTQGFAKESLLFPLPRKKIINICNSHPFDPGYTRKHIHELETQLPVDGNCFVIFARNQKGEEIANSTRCWGPENICRYESFAQDVADLKATKFQKWTDNFISVFVTPGDMELYDDDAWTKTYNNIRIFARVAREVGFKGLLLDPEDYSRKKIFQFKYYPEQGKTFQEAQQKMRERGQEFIRTVNEEFPDVAILSYWLTSILPQLFWQQQEPIGKLMTSKTGLFPAFLNGILDSINPTSRLVDLNEYYEYCGELDHLRAYNANRTAGIRLIAPENREKFRTQVSCSFPIYLDLYARSVGTLNMIPASGFASIDLLQENLHFALRISDEYVWLYNETGSWCNQPIRWEWARQSAQRSPVGGRQWEEVLPGITDILRDATNIPRALQLTLARRSKIHKLTNLSNNPLCTDTKTTADDYLQDDWQDIAPGYGFWQDEQSKGTGIWNQANGFSDKTSLELRGVNNGCFTHSTVLENTGRYVVQAKFFNHGSGIPQLTVRWKNAKKQWFRWDLDVCANIPSKQDEWCEAIAEGVAPQGVGYLILLLGVSGQQDNSSYCRWDNIEIYHLESANGNLQ
jgi:hypothetical protein